MKMMHIRKSRQPKTDDQSSFCAAVCAVRTRSRARKARNVGRSPSAACLVELPAHFMQLRSTTLTPFVVSGHQVISLSQSHAHFKTKLARYLYENINVDVNSKVMRKIRRIETRDSHENSKSS